MDIVRICDAFDWDYDTFMKQPKWFIELRIMKRSADDQFIKNKKV